jgi:hypothetical protein
MDAPGEATREFRVYARDRDNGFIEASEPELLYLHVLGVLTNLRFYKSHGHGLRHGCSNRADVHYDVYHVFGSLN